MARTRKSVSTQNLIKYDVLIEDRGTRSDYFKISQFDGYLYGGRNAFLVAGSGVLRPRSKVLVEVLNKDGSTIFSAPVSSFVEGNSRLVQVEVYEDTPIGPGKIVILGSADTYIDGTPIPPEWRGKYNVRWITDVIISPRIENRTQIRFERSPSMTVSEKFYFAPSSSLFSSSQELPLDVEFTPKFLNVYPNGYLAKIITSGSLPSTTARYFSNYAGGVLSGSVKFVGPLGPETASINLPLNKIYTSKLAESDGNLIVTDKNRILTSLTVSSSGQYITNVEPIGSVGVTSSLNLVYNELITQDTGSLLSFADIRVVDLETISGEINKVRFSYKSATRPGGYKIIGEVVNEVDELFAVDTGSRIAQTGRFRDVVADDYWYTATMSVAKNEISPSIPTYYITSSLVTNSSVTQCCTDLLDSINATPEIVGNDFIDGVSYFIGNDDINSIRLFPRSEYTLTLDALVTKQSASYSLSQSDYSLEIYLVPISGSTKLLETNALGQLIGTLTPKSGFKSQRFNQLELNFVPRIIESGQYGIRFVVYGGFWNIANVSVKTATEPFFSPDELDALLPNLEFQNEILEFKAEYLDVNNNSIGISTTSLPVFFTGSEIVPLSSYSGSFSGTFTGDGSGLTDVEIFPYTGSAKITGSLEVTGSVLISGSSTFKNIGPAEITGSLSVYKSGSTAFDIQGSSGQLFSVTDDLTGTLMSVSDVSGIPILEVNADNKVVMGTFGSNTLVVNGDKVGIKTNSPNNELDVSGSVAITEDLTVGGRLTAQEFHTEFVSSSIIYDSGSTKFGDSLDDIHSFTGSVKINGSLLAPSIISASSQIDHDQTTNFNAAEHFTQANITTVGTVTSGNVTAILPGGIVSASSQVSHDSTTGFVSDEHIAHSGVSITAGNGLTGGGTIAASRTINVASANNGITVNADNIQLDTASSTFTTGVKNKLNTDNVVSSSAQIDHDQTTNFSADEHFTQANITTVGTVTAGNINAILPNGVVSASSQINHDSTTGFVSDEHIAHSTVSISAGTGLTGGGTIAANRTISHADTSTQASVNNSGRTFIQDITLDDFGHVTGITSATDSDTFTGTVTSVATNNGITGGTITSTGTIGLTGQALALHNLATSGFIARTGTGTVAARTFDAGTGINITKPDGVDGDPQFSVDVSDFMSNGANNRIVTATGTDAMNAEENLTFDGSVLLVTGEIKATSEITAYHSSDINLKTNVTPLTDPLLKLKQINGVEFDWKQDYIDSRGGEDDYFVRKHDVGVIAQEIQSVLPEVVATRQDGTLAVRYEKIVPLLIEAIKELNAKVEYLESRSLQD